MASEWSQYNVSRFAASLAYYTTISFAPVLVIIVAIVGFVLGSEEARQQVVQQANSQIGPQGAKMVGMLLQNIATRKSGIIATIVSAFVVLLGASGLFVELRNQLNTLWRCQPKNNGNQIESLVKGRFKAFLIMIGIGFLMLLSVVGSLAVTAAGKQFQQWIPISGTALQIGDYLFSLVLATVLFGLIYRFVPNLTLDWRHILLGAAITAVLFVGGKIAIGYYLAEASVGSAYGAAGSLVVVLVWLYYSSQVFLIGAILTYTFSRASHFSPVKVQERPRRAA
ncbi:MAG TPA: YihY/virulence factor BrkB family protein [Bryobacteraceae bacterium]|nr:YihY/virulence factor BrkB family protein [Bryobacteraceae bacterium]